MPSLILSLGCNKVFFKIKLNIRSYIKKVIILRIINLIENTQGAEGCAHNGRLSILDEYKRLYGSDPDMVISGFHLSKAAHKMAENLKKGIDLKPAAGMKTETGMSATKLLYEYSREETEYIRKMAEELTGFRTKFVTCHCTGMEAYGILKDIMKNQLMYVHSGEEIRVEKNI